MSEQPNPAEPTKAELIQQLAELSTVLHRHRQMIAQIKRETMVSVSTVILAAGGKVTITKEIVDRVPGMQLGRVENEDGSVTLDVREKPAEPTPEFIPDGL